MFFCCYTVIEVFICGFSFLFYNIKCLNWEWFVNASRRRKGVELGRKAANCYGYFARNRISSWRGMYIRWLHFPLYYMKMHLFNMSVHETGSPTSHTSRFEVCQHIARWLNESYGKTIKLFAQVLFMVKLPIRFSKYTWYPPLYMWSKRNLWSKR